MEIDIRKPAEVTSIRVGEYLSLVHLGVGALTIRNDISPKVSVDYEDVPNLILALQKALELRGAAGCDK